MVTFLHIDLVLHPLQVHTYRIMYQVNPTATQNWAKGKHTIAIMETLTEVDLVGQRIPNAHVSSRVQN